ncbi:MAG: cytochrome b/b6 domain-containing protein [Rhodanobacteraceae bacterium]
MMPEKRTSQTTVWDLPTRLFHWILVLLIALQFASGELELLPMEWHFRLGYVTLALILFRLLWGFFGSTSARFRTFVRSPWEVLRYLGNSIAGRESRHVGHNPLGGWSVIAMLLCVAVQALSGLFASDDISEYGPLGARVSDATVDLLTRVHKINRYVLAMLIALHLTAVLLHWILKRDNLVAPMLHGRMRVAADQAAPSIAPLWRALVLVLISAAIVWGIVAWGEAA